MKKFITFVLSTVIALASFQANAEIREITKMKDILAEVQADTLLVFDLDNTLHEPAQSLGSDQWYTYMVKENVKSGMPESAAIDKAIKLWNEVQLQTKVKTLEGDTPKIISDLQKKGVRIFGLTARPAELVDSSLKQLKTLNIDLSKTSKLKDGVQIPAEDVVTVKSGVVFVGPKNNKGKVLKSLLESEKAKVTKVVMVDDKEKHVKNIEASLAELKVPYVGFRYGAADPQVKGFDPKVAQKQLDSFLKTKKL